MSRLLVKSESITYDVSELAKETRDDVIEIQQVSDNIMFVLMLVLVGAAVATALLVARAISKPLTRLLGGIRTIAEGDLDEEIDIRSRDEMGQLATSFNEMTTRLRQSHTSVSNLQREVAQRKKSEQ